MIGARGGSGSGSPANNNSLSVEVNILFSTVNISKLNPISVILSVILNTNLFSGVSV